MASLFCTGPMHVFIGPPGDIGTTQPTLSYLGTTKISPAMDVQPHYRVHTNSFAGDKPADHSYQGRSGTVVCEFTRWVEKTYALVVSANGQKANVAGSDALNTRGTDEALDIGTLMRTEGYSIGLFLVFPFALKSTFIAGQMPIGYHWLSATLRNESMPHGGSRPRRIRLVWDCLSVVVAPTKKPGEQPKPVEPKLNEKQPVLADTEPVPTLKFNPSPGLLGEQSLNTATPGVSVATSSPKPNNPVGGAAGPASGSAIGSGLGFSQRQTKPLSVVVAPRVIVPKTFPGAMPTYQYKFVLYDQNFGAVEVGKLSSKMTIS